MSVQEKPPPTPTKGAKFKSALKSAARLPRIPSIKAGRGSGRSDFTPKSGEPPVVIFRIQVIGCLDVLAKDRGGTSDPFVVVSILNTRQQTPVAKRTTNPVYAAKDATFDFPLYLSLADKLGVVEFVVWDKDMLTKEYLGEAALPLDDWFYDKVNGKERAFGFDQPGNEAISLNLISTRANTASTGSVQVKFGFVPIPNSTNLMDFDEIYAELVKRSRPSLVSAPPTEGVGTVRSNQVGGPQYEDDGGLSSDSDDSDDEEFVDASDATPPSSTGSDSVDKKLGGPETSSPESVSSSSDTGRSPPPLNLPEVNVIPTSPATPTPGNLPTPMAVAETEATPKASAGFAVPSPSSSRFLPKKFVRKFSGLSGTGSAPSSPGVEASTAMPDSPAVDSDGNLVPIVPSGKHRSASKERKKFGRSWSSHSSASTTGSSQAETGTAGPTPTPSTPRLAIGRRRHSAFEFKGSNDIVGIVMLEVLGADDLPRLTNMTRTGWDMDPFAVISFGKKVFRTRVIRHSRSPVWEEKMLFHVRRYETAFKIQFTILDWDKLSSNDLIGETGLDLKELVQNAPQPDPVTGLYAHGEEEGGGPEKGMKEFTLPVQTAKGMPWESKHSPVIRFRAKYQPYDALRQRFWRQYLQQYDADDTNTMNHLELTSMLDSLGSTLTRSTISSFFTRNGKEPHKDELSIEQAIQCLEEEIKRPDSEKKRLDADDGADTSVVATPVMMAAGAKGEELQLDKLDFSGPAHVNSLESSGGEKPSPPPAYPTEGMQNPLSQVAEPDSSESDLDDLMAIPGDGIPASSTTASLTPTTVASQKTKKARFRASVRRAKKAKESSEDSSPSEASVERVINVKNCPLCHRPRLNSKAEVDIITHLAICASQDWNKVDQIVVGNFVTASQAQRKWYTKVISKVSSGDYKLGANSANIIVQNRISGQLEEEKMQVYVRLGIRLLYKGASSRMEGGRARRLLKSLSIKQGIKYDDPESAKEIPAFIAFHNLAVDEILDPLDSFKTFNEFFYRKLKASARPVEEPENPNRLVSGADCRFMAFETVSEATRLWIKGREFSVARLLGDAYKGQADNYNGGALCIFRLAPQDYHRFHSPVDGTIGPMTYISGEYYTVNPQAIRTALDVYGENARKIVPIDSPQFGRVFAVCVGAMMVGSIQTTVEEGQQVKRGQEFGYFAFGGSTIVVLFEKGKIQWDEDLLINGKASLETLVRVGMGIGRLAQ